MLELLKSAFLQFLWKIRLPASAIPMQRTFNISVLLFILPPISVCPAFAQQSGKKPSHQEQSIAQKPKHDPLNEATPPTTYTFVEQMPQFSGDLSVFISNNLHYPDSARVNGMEGRTVVRFIVRKDGSVTNAVVVRTAGNKEMDAEALRMISIMPRWNPGRNNGGPVDVPYTMPIIFRLD